MFTTKFRATCAAVSTALTIALAIGPMTPLSQAAPNMGPRRCQILMEYANVASDYAAAAYERGDAAQGRASQNAADQMFQIARKGGCAWAIW
jgi:hypothetical protein